MLFGGLLLVNHPVSQEKSKEFKKPTAYGKMILNKVKSFAMSKEKQNKITVYHLYL